MRDQTDNELGDEPWVIIMLLTDKYNIETTMQVLADIVTRTRGC